MFSAVIRAFRTADLRNKLLFTLAIVAIYRLGSVVTAPGIDVIAISDFFQNQGSQGLLGLSFTARIAGETEVEGQRAILPEITGSAYLTGFSQSLFDPRVAGQLLQVHRLDDVDAALDEEHAVRRQQAVAKAEQQLRRAAQNHIAAHGCGRR